MTAKTFERSDARNLLQSKTILFFGDSNMRALYKDLIWLLQYGTLIPSDGLKRKNECSFAKDRRLSNGRLNNSCNYKEIREYTKNFTSIKYEFLTRVFQDRFIDAIHDLEKNIKQYYYKYPPIVIMNSCLWDISRYGPNSIEAYQENIIKAVQFLKRTIKSIKIIWITTLPPSFKSRGGFLNEEAGSIQSLLPFHIMQANDYVVRQLTKYDVDILDLHYLFKFLIDMRAPDGIHWTPTPVRYMTNLLLTRLEFYWKNSSNKNDHHLNGDVNYNHTQSFKLVTSVKDNFNNTNTIINKIGVKRKRNRKGKNINNTYIIKNITENIKKIRYF